ncbi:MAG: sensor histidine kinase [Ignavibacterium sp.]|nr:sensor histidine kinase [Ignavibacterium sp.]
MEEKNYLILDQYRTDSTYNDFVGHFYHFPKKYLNLLSQGNIEFIYYEPKKNGEGIYFGSGKIVSEPFPDKMEDGFYFVEIVQFKKFSKKVYLEFENDKREKPPYYNSQNSVRRTNKQTFDEICLDGGILLNFQADAHLLKVLGEELIATEKVGILELIKNAYDAQATYCNIKIENVPGLLELPSSAYTFPNLAGPVIIIEDDGIGMDMNTIENSWLRPASTFKTNIKDRIKLERQKAIEKGQLGTFETIINNIKKQNGGRLPVGEKGVGRFATRRLGNKLILKTKVPSNDYEYLLQIDWDRFDIQDNTQFIDLSNVGVSLTRTKLTRDYGKRKSGTQLIIYGGRPGFELSEILIKEINKTCLQMKSPHRGPNDFDVNVSCPQMPDLEKNLITDDFDAIFSFTGIVDENGKCDFEFSFNPPRSVPLSKQTIKQKDFDLRELKKEDWKKLDNSYRVPECGQFFININAWIRTRPWIEGPRENEFKEYLDQYGGVSIFRDGLNVFSSEFGSKIDWLELSTRHIKRGLNISYYNIIGSIELDQTSNINLIDKTNREGLLNNKALADLSKLTRAVVLYLENRFRAKRDEYHSLSGDILREPKLIGDVSRQAAILVNNVADQYDISHDPLKILQNFGKGDIAKERLVDLGKSLKNLQKSLNAMQHVQDLLTEQAGFGLAIAVSVHEIAKITSSFYDRVVQVANGANLSQVQRDELRVSLDSLRNELKRLSPLRAIRNEERQEFNVKKSISFIRDVYRKKIQKNEIEFIIEGSKGFNVFARFGALNQVFSNLVDNSIYWLDAKGVKEKIIKIVIDEQYRSVLFADSNGDIEDSILPHIFEPGYSLKDPPSGLGLYISKYYIFDMKGNIYLAPERDRIIELNGAQFILDFSRTPSKREELK